MPITQLSFRSKKAIENSDGIRGRKRFRNLLLKKLKFIISEINFEVSTLANEPNYITYTGLKIRTFRFFRKPHFY